MTYEDVSFQAEDGVNLAAWLIKRTSDRLIITTHPMPFTRDGFDPKQQGLFQVTDIQVKLRQTVKQLHDAGYNVLTFDFRNHGESDEANDGFSGVGLDEWRDVVAAMEFVKGRVAPRAW